MAERILVVGGNAAGMTAASRAKRLDPALRITVLESSRFISYSICGLPYALTGEVKSHQDLVAFTPQSLKEERGLQARIRVKVQEILPGRRVILCRDLESDEEFELGYDRLVLATGYVPRLPRIVGTELEGLFTVSRLEHGIAMRERLSQSQARRAAIVGGGYIGLMMAQALRTLGLEVMLMERNRHLYSQVDEEMALEIEQELSRQGVELLLGTAVHSLRGRNGRLEAVEAAGKLHAVDLALLDVGVAPNTELARGCGIPCGMSTAVQVDDRGQTPVSGIYAAGNCAETRHLVSGRPIFSALGTTAAKQGRVVGENLSGRRSTFAGSLETSVEKVFGLSVARTGLTLRQALQSGFEADAVTVKARDRASYYPASQSMKVRLVFEKRGGRLLGGQILGGDLAAKRIDTLVTALTAKMSLQDLSQLDLAYAPPYATLWDPIQIAANVGLRKVRRW